MKQTSQKKRATATTAATAINTEQVKAILKKPETILGGLVLLGTGVFAAYSIVTSQSTATTMLPEFPEIVAEETVNASTVNETVAQETPSLEKIEVLANTSGNAVVIAQPGDTIWDLTRRYCGTDAPTEMVETANGYGRYKELQAGDRLVIACE